MKNKITETTKKLQKMINDAPENGKLVLPAGRYEIGSLFLKSKLTLELAEGCEILGSQDLADYPQIKSRIAGIEMTWPAALINIVDCSEVKIFGTGTINGQGKIWWEKYWGTDHKSGMMADYEKRGLRWIVDYDCQRPRNILIQNSQNIQLEQIHSLDSGFWNVQILYSQFITVKKLTIKNGPGPSTDGIDIDSSQDVLIDQCHVACNDDNICVKSGRGQEAFLQQKTTERVKISNCKLGVGSGITLGSEVSGGIRDIEISDNEFFDTGVGFRIKSSKNRGGFIENIRVKNLTMHNVHFAVKFDLNWFPAYSYSGDTEDVAQLPIHWQKIIDDVKGLAGLTRVKNIEIDTINATKDPQQFSRALYFGGLKEQPIENLTLKNIKITATEFGEIHAVKNLVLDHVVLNVEEKTDSARGKYAR
ncbi:glycoside hydrolase family 28 protein [Enterococcus timonensis]|uniref:glycoside hydrolase family 28 protein n=1 Tax=Enterococcus timonensis TaxID=1852364 RepID=UPI0008DB1475|nr:glycosyl hydrolase family 28 protein [Enterococcus timonensis]